MTESQMYRDLKVPFLFQHLINQMLPISKLKNFKRVRFINRIAHHCHADPEERRSVLCIFGFDCRLVANHRQDAGATGFVVDGNVNQV